MSLIQRIDALLPQTQCGKCGHPGCKPYAQGIAAGEPINRCPPGGSETIAALAELLQTPIIEIDLQRGSAPAQVARIREAECIGCTKCIQACPVDAILGAAKQMHTVLIDECTGCDLCVAPCPVDCIDLIPLAAIAQPVIALVGDPTLGPTQQQARSAKRDQARQRFENRTARLQRDLQRKQLARQVRLASPPMPSPVPNAPLSAIERIKAQKALAQDTALKQARIAVTMTRAQVNKTRQAYDSPPTAEQFARLQILQAELDGAEAYLLSLQPSILPSVQDCDRDECSQTP
jgi:electron transport complex protein RnfB